MSNPPKCACGAPCYSFEDLSGDPHFDTVCWPCFKKAESAADSRATAFNLPSWNDDYPLPSNTVGRL